MEKFRPEYFFQWSYGNDILNANRMVFENPASKQNTNMYATYINRWTPDNPTSNMPRSTANGSNEYSSLYVEDGSFLKLKIFLWDTVFLPKYWLLYVSVKHVSICQQRISPQLPVTLEVTRKSQPGILP